MAENDIGGHRMMHGPAISTSAARPMGQNAAEDVAGAVRRVQRTPSSARRRRGRCPFPRSAGSAGSRTCFQAQALAPGQENTERIHETGRAAINVTDWRSRPKPGRSPAVWALSSRSVRPSGRGSGAPQTPRSSCQPKLGKGKGETTSPRDPTGIPHAPQREGKTGIFGIDRRGDQAGAATETMISLRCFPSTRLPKMIGSEMGEQRRSGCQPPAVPAPGSSHDDG